MLILVTGGTGLTGTAVVNELLSRGHRVRILTRSPADNLEGRDGIDVVRGDLADPASVFDATSGVAGIVHTACSYSDSRIDVGAMNALLDGWRVGPFVFMSSLDVYGLTNDQDIDETHPLSSSYNDYATGKVHCEQVLEARASSPTTGGQRHFVSLRAPHIWGPHPTAKRRLLREFAHDGPIVLPGEDRRAWSKYTDAWIDVRDLAVVVADCVSPPPDVSLNTALNVLSGHFNWHDLYTDLVRLVGVQPGAREKVIAHTPLAEIEESELAHPEQYAQHWTFSVERLTQLLGPQTRHSLDQTLRDTVNYGVGAPVTS